MKPDIIVLVLIVLFTLGILAYFIWRASLVIDATRCLFAGIKARFRSRKEKKMKFKILFWVSAGALVIGMMMVIIIAFLPVTSRPEGLGGLGMVLFGCGLMSSAALAGPAFWS